MAKTVSATEYLNYEGGNFSKSEGVGVFGNDVRFTNIPVEVSDASFKWKDLQGKLNSKLLGLGNFVNRVLLLIAGYGSVIPDAPRAKSHILTKCVGDKVGRLVAEYVKAMEKVQLKHGLNTAMLVVGQGHKYWRLYKGDKSRSAVFSRTAAAKFASTFSPSDERGELLQASRPWEILPHNHRIGTPLPLFEFLKDEDVEWYKEMFAGSLAPERARRRPRPVEAASSAMDALAI
uniref:Methionyl-tRNA synthetase, putative n=1 Tax=Brassica oleracea TaxID=3712 RepID=Q2A9C6_BRAOL|nr:methionyl-tRNA synthetase, putative [Brassica oleracea]